MKKIAYNKQAYDKVFHDLEEYLDFCRFELREFNPAHLYDKGNWNFRAFLGYKHGNWKRKNNRNNHRNNDNNGRRYNNQNGRGNG
jgi:hypothetical protein